MLVPAGVEAGAGVVAERIDLLRHGRATGQLLVRIVRKGGLGKGSGWARRLGLLL